MEDHRASLLKATDEKLQLYKQAFSADSKVPFWDLVVLTAGNEEQKKSFQEQIEIKTKRKEIPTSVRYLVFCDPPGAKIGNGGATMHVLQELEQLLGWEKMKIAKVLLVHAGGYSQRLASVSAVGKVFMTLPCGESLGNYQMLDVLLIMYADLPTRMSPGVFLVSSDVLFLYNGIGDWNMREPGVTAIAHPAPLDLCTNHGVFVFKDVNEVWDKYNKDRSRPACMGEVSRFLHKCSLEAVKKGGGLIPGQNQIYVDLAYWFDFDTVKKMIKFYSDHQPLDCEIDAYGDFLQALGPEATPEYCERTGHVSVATETLVETRKKLYQVLRDTPFRAVVLNEAQFNHVGTTKEYLHHLCYNHTLMESLHFKTETTVQSISNTDQESEKEPTEKRMKLEPFQNCAIMCSQLNNRESIQIGPGSVVEYCVVGEGVKIGTNCVLSGLTIPADSAVPDSSFLHTLPVSVDEKTCYTTFAFDISDSMKTCTDPPLDLPFCTLTVGEAIKRLLPDDPDFVVWPNKTSKCSLWNARLFPVFPNRELSSQFAIETIRCLKDTTQKPPQMDVKGLRMFSVLDMLQNKSLKTLLSYSNQLREYS
ncbi:fucose-1-phosphate guanylyltransferase-like [Halichondria panicea]|uniref:fucose-1-phosphate guanylyltransferase-like n=1 Tax=Halichondria panicea TaxID=6063 RepID=UPI00312B71C4